MSAYVAVVEPGAEFAVITRLGERKVVCWLPCSTHFRHIGRRMDGLKVRQRRPVLPGYVFFWSVDLDVDFAAVRHAPGVLGILGHHDRAAELPLGWLAIMWAMVTFGAFDYTLDTRPTFTVMQLVKIIGGPFSGQDAVIVQVLNEARCRVEVSGKYVHGLFPVDNAHLAPRTAA